jgi:hypothetical protein
LANEFSSIFCNLTNPFAEYTAERIMKICCHTFRTLLNFPLSTALALAFVDATTAAGLEHTAAANYEHAKPTGPSLAASSGGPSFDQGIPAITNLPPLAPGVTELKFDEFFVRPVGPKGLTLTEKLRRLDGKRVRMIGYMVEQDKGVPGVFLFSALPIQLHDHDAALADDLPAAVVHVSVPTCRDQRIPHARGRMLLTGVLSIGPRDEPDGRVSNVRLALDPPQAFKD